MTESDLGGLFIPSLYKSASLLPVARHRESLLYLIETFPVVIVIGQTGSGKSTQIPQFLEQAGWCTDGKVIAVTQVGWLSYCHHPLADKANTNEKCTAAKDRCHYSRVQSG